MAVYVTGFIIILISIPILINLLMISDFGFKVAKDNVWIGFYGGYIGSILSGLLTLGGVYLTLRNQKNQEIKNNYPKVIVSIDDIENFLSEVSIIELSYRKSYFESCLNHCDSLLKDRKIYLEVASKINGDVYKSIKNILNSLKLIASNRLFLNSKIDELSQEVVDYDSLKEQEAFIIARFKEIKEDISLIKIKIDRIISEYEKIK